MPNNIAKPYLFARRKQHGGISFPLSKTVAVHLAAVLHSSIPFNVSL